MRRVCLGDLNKSILLKQCSRFQPLIIGLEVGQCHCRVSRIAGVLQLFEQEGKALDQLRKVRLIVLSRRDGEE
jgi:hypothetical protein